MLSNLVAIMAMRSMLLPDTELEQYFGCESHRVSDLYHKALHQT